MNIVLIDDNSIIRHVIAKIINFDKSNNIKVFSSDNGLEGFAYIYFTKPEIIIIDSTLPKYSGEELLEEIISTKIPITSKIILLDDGFRSNKLIQERVKQFPHEIYVLQKEDKKFFRHLNSLLNYKNFLEDRNRSNFLKNWAAKLINTANKIDLEVQKYQQSKKIFTWSRWLIYEAYSYLLFIPFLLIYGKNKNENIEQHFKDLKKFRIKYYPSIATGFTLFLFFASQIFLLIGGGVTIGNKYLNSIFISGKDKVSINMDSANFHNKGISLTQNKIKFIPKNFVLGIDTETQTNDDVEKFSNENPDELDGQEEEIIIIDETNEIEEKPSIVFDDPVEFSDLISIVEVSSSNNDKSSKEEPKDGFTIGKYNENGITYQISPNKDDWFFFDGEEWEKTEFDWKTSNSIQEVNKYLDSYDDLNLSNELYLKTFLHSDGTNEIELENIYVERDIEIIAEAPLQEDIEENKNVEIEEKEIEVDIGIIFEEIEPVVLNASWGNINGIGTKVIEGRINFPKGFDLKTTHNLKIKAYYTDSENIRKTAKNKTEFIGETDSITNVLQNNDEVYKYSIRVPGQRGGFVTTLIEWTDSEGNMHQSGLSKPVKNSTFTVDDIGDDPDVNPGDLSCSTAGGVCTLRAAIEETNNVLNDPGDIDNIHFNILGAGVQTITFTGPIPAISDPVSLDGSTQPSASCGDLWNNVSPNFLIEVDANGEDYAFNIESGSSIIRGITLHGYTGKGIWINNLGDNFVECNLIGTDTSGTIDLSSSGLERGVVIESTSNNTIGGIDAGDGNLISGNSSYGILISPAGADNNLIYGNFVGTDINGTTSLPNDDYGISIKRGIGNQIGGPRETNIRYSNLISGGNFGGLEIGHPTAENNQIQGNYIGTDINGTSIIPNASNGIKIDDSSNNVIGGSSNGEGNIVSGNEGSGITLTAGTSADNLIIGNIIGSDPTATLDLGNSFTGISLTSVLSNNIIGGVDEGEENIIVSNGTHGIAIADTDSTIILGNYIGTNVSGDNLGNTGDGIFIITSDNNLIGGENPDSANIIAFNSTGITTTSLSSNATILQNKIYNNTFLGIDSHDNGVSPNDSDESDGIQNYPIINTVTTDRSTSAIRSTFTSTPNTTYRIEFFENNIADDSGYGEGRNFLTYRDIRLDATGTTDLNPFGLPGIHEDYLTMTATPCDDATADGVCDGTYGETSEFSNALLVDVRGSSRPANTPTPTEEVTPSDIPTPSSTEAPTPTLPEPTAREKPITPTSTVTPDPTSESRPSSTIVPTTIVTSYEVTPKPDSNIITIDEKTDIQSPNTPQIIIQESLKRISTSIVENPSLTLIPIASVVLLNLVATPSLIIYAIPWLLLLYRKKKWGKIYDLDNSNGLSGAYVYIIENDKPIAKTVSGIDGSYGFGKVKAGNNTIKVEKNNYYTREIEFYVPERAEEIRLDIALIPENQREITNILSRWNNSIKTNIYKLNITIFLLGFAFSLYILLLYPSLTNFVVVCIYVVQILMYMTVQSITKTRIRR